MLLLCRVYDILALGNVREEIENSQIDGVDSLIVSRWGDIKCETEKSEREREREKS